MYTDVTCVIKTFLRPKSIKNCIKSIYKYYPKISVHVADDSHEDNEYVKKTVKKYIRLPFDSGLSKGRNALIDSVKTKYVLLMDDDTLFTQHTKLELMYFVLENTTFDIVAGLYNDKRSDKNCCRYGMFSMQKDVLHIKYNKYRKMHEGYPMYDICPNFFMGRTESIARVKWDNKLKICEHIDFYVRANGTKLAITLLPCIEALNCSTSNKQYDKFRLKRWSHYSNKKDTILKKFGINDVVHEELEGNMAIQPVQYPPVIYKLLPKHEKTFVVGIYGCNNCAIKLFRILKNIGGAYIILKTEYTREITNQQIRNNINKVIQGGRGGGNNIIGYVSNLFINKLNIIQKIYPDVRIVGYFDQKCCQQKNTHDTQTHVHTNSENIVNYIKVYS